MKRAMIVAAVVLSACAVAGPVPQEVQKFQHEDTVTVDVLTSPED